MESRGEQKPDQQAAATYLALTSCVRVSHYPLLCWHQPGDLLAKKGAVTVRKSAGRITEQLDGQLVYKQTSTPFVVKTGSFKDRFTAQKFSEINQIATRIPYAKIKPPQLVDTLKLFNIVIVMAELPGQTLADLLFEQGSRYKKSQNLEMSATERLEIMLEAAWNLQSQIHASGVVHRDITPANIMVDGSVSPPKVRIFDFDHCKLIEENEVKEAVGTPFFMSAEAFAYENTTFKTDVYGLAWIFYFLLGGKLPVMNKLVDCKRVASCYSPKELFKGIESELSEDETIVISDLLKKMFEAKQSERCDLQCCIDTIENILLARKKLTPSLVTAYSIGKGLRQQLIEIAFACKIGDKPQINVIELFEQLPVNELASPDALTIFLSALRIDSLSNLTSIEAVKQKAREIIEAFNERYQASVNLKDELELDYMMLRERWKDENIHALKNLVDATNYLLQYYEPFNWSLDNLALVDHKLTKMLDRLPGELIEKTRQAAANAREEREKRCAEWALFLSAQKAAQSMQREEGHPSEVREPPNAKRKIY